MTKKTLNVGSVPVTIGGTTHKLLPVMGAILAINDEFGGYIAADRQCVGANIRAISFVVASAMDAEDPPVDDVLAHMLSDGVQDTQSAARAYLELIYSGGKAKSEGGGTTTTDPSKPKPGSTPT